MKDIVDTLYSLVTLLNRDQINYAICGGFAMALHGYSRATDDIDVIIHFGDLGAVRNIAKEAGFQLEPDPIHFPDSGTTVWRLVKIMVNEDLTCPLDIMMLDENSEIEINVEELPWRDLVVKVVDKNTLIQLKKAASRPLDLIGIERLQNDNSHQK